MGIEKQGRRSLKNKWLNLMLHFSGVISKYKLKLIEITGPKTIIYGLFILLLEIVNIIIAFPAYALISSKEFAGNDKNAIKTYRLRRIMSISALLSVVLAIIIFILVAFFGLVIFPGRGQAAIASWDFNTPLAYHYDTSKIQIIDGAAIFKATPAVVEIVPIIEETPTAEPAPIVEPTPEPTVEPTPEPVPTPAPVPASPLLHNFLKSLFGIQMARAETNACSAMLTTITPLVVTPFIKWDGFYETAQKNGGGIYYALSGDGGLNWLYWNGSDWVDAGTDSGNTASEINSHISTFPVVLSETGAGTLMFRAKFVSDCTQDISLFSLTANYQDQPTQIISIGGEDTEETVVLISEADPTVVAVEDSLAVVAETSIDTSTQIEIPVVESTVVTEITNDTSLGAETETSAPSDTLVEPSLETTTEIAPITDTSIDTNTPTPITFSVHTVIKTTDTEGNVLYSIPGLFSLEEGPDNGLQVKVTGTDLQVAMLTYGGLGSHAHVTVGDHIVVIVYDASKLSLYIDGAISATLDAPIVIAPPANVSTSLGCVSAGFVLQALSLAQINANYLECSNQAPAINITQAQASDDGFINIVYIASDANNDLVSLSAYEYSITGAFAGEELPMTPATQDADHSGVNALQATQAGRAHTFVWNVNADIPNSAANVYVRLRVTDGLAFGSADIFYPVHVGTKAPMLSNFTGKQTVGSGKTMFNYTISDAENSLGVTLELSADGGVTWTIPVVSASGGIGNINNANKTHSILWDAQNDFPNFEGVVQARLTATDMYGKTSIETEFALDTRVPVALADFKGTESNTKQILWQWSPSDDTNFDRYIITYGIDENSVKNDTDDIKLWGPSKDSDLSIGGADRTVITGLSADILYYAKITAFDDYGHSSVSAITSFKTLAEAAIVATEDVLPVASTAAPIVPSGGFDISINDNTADTENKNVTLSLAGGNAELMLVSNNSDLSDAGLQDYNPKIAWNICAGLDACESGTYVVYAKFYTKFGVGSVKVIDTITLANPIPKIVENTPVETIEENSPPVSGGGSGGGGGQSSAPAITIVTNEDSSANQNSDTSGSQPNNQVTTNMPLNSESGSGQNVSDTIASSFVATSSAISQSAPELNVLAESRESRVIAKPEVALVKKSFTGQTINFAGTGIPNAKIALFIHSDQVVVYTTDAGVKGDWSFTHHQNDIELAPGEHTVFAVTYDPGSKVKSKPSLVSTFEVKKNPAAVMLGYTNLPTTLLTFFVLLIGTIYLYSLKKKKA